MIDALFNQAGYLGAKRMLDASMVRHGALAANIANAETPHYKRVDLAPSFVKELKSAMGQQDKTRLQSLQAQVVTDVKALAANRDGNTVNLENELVQLSQNTLQYQVETQIVSASLAKLRLAITGRTS